MVKLNKIYTRAGDKGKTGLVSGKRVFKDNIRIKAYGTVDELNSILGILNTSAKSSLKKIISEIQNDLFDLGADLATPVEKKPKYKPLRVTSKQVTRIEKTIDKYKEGRVVVGITEYDYQKHMYPSITICTKFTIGRKTVLVALFNTTFEKSKASGT